MGDKATLNPASEWTRMQAAQAEQIAYFVRRYTPQYRDEAFEFERDFHYLLQRQTEIAQRPWQRMLSDTLASAPFANVPLVKP